jgi:O-antigen ligase
MRLPQLRIRADILLVAASIPLLLAVGAESSRAVDRYGIFKVVWLILAAGVGVVGSTSIPRSIAVLLFASAIVFRTSAIVGIEFHTTHILLLFLAVQVLVAWAYGRIVVPRGLTAPLVLILAGAVIASVAGPDTTWSFIRGASGLLLPVIAGIAAATLTRGKDIDRLVIAMAGAVAAEGTIALLQVTGKAFGPLAPIESGRVNGLFLQTNILGGYLAAGSLLLLGVGVHLWARSRAAAVALVVPIGLGIAGIGATLSRGALLALVAGIGVLLVLSLRGRELWVLLALLAGVAAVAIPQIPQSQRVNYQQRFSQLLQPDAESGRQFIYKQAEQEIRKYPLTGMGPLAFGANIAKHGTIPGGDAAITHAHNIILEGYLSLGPIGLFGFIWLLVLSVRRYLRVLRRPKLDPVLKGFAAGALAALASFLVQGMVDFLFWQLEVLVLLMVILAVGFALDSITRGGEAV